MTHTRLLRGALLVTLLIPTAALAYISPEQVLSSEENARFFDPPPNAREAESVQAAQQASVAARRQREQELLFETISSSSSSEASSEDNDSLHGAAPVAGQQSSLSLEEQRILERVRTQQADAEIDARVQMIISQQGLHSGAPLSHTGPETAIAGFILAGAGIWTIWKAKRMDMRR